MNKHAPAKLIAIALSVALVAGCASKPEPEPAPEPEKVCPTPAANRALDEARAALNEARAVNAVPQGAANALAQAEAAAAECDDQRVMQLVNSIKSASEQSVNDHYSRLAKAAYDEIMTYSNLSPSQMARLQEGEAAWAAGDRRRAYEIFSALLAELKASRMVYNVMQGDNLWKIAGKSDVYGDPYQWPLIYKNNTDKIKDADLIYPGQALDVEKNPTKGAVEAAVKHAKNRGAWSVGQVEQSDRDYLSGN